MKFQLFMVACLFFGLCACEPALAQKDDFDPSLINGRPAGEGEFPEAVYVAFGSSRCSASIVGEQVLLSAAHCARNGARGRFQVGQTLYSTEGCARHPAYPRRDVDLLLCKITRAVEGVKPAQIGGEVKRGDKITIVGYGCTRPGGGGGNDGILRVGTAEVVGFSGHDIVSRGSGLCYGDSGGPAYVHMEDAYGERHIQVSVNSKGNIRDTNYTAITYNETATAWMRRFAEANEVDICGVTKDCFEPEVERCPEEAELVSFLEKKLATARQIYEACQSAMAP